VARGYGEPDEAKRFLRPKLSDLGDPTLLADADTAADRIAQAVRANETVFVHGDYDVDGICATALLTRWLRSLGGTVVPFVPHRLRDGYDFSIAGLEAAVEAGADLIVTADCGTVAHQTVADAHARGIDVIVTDHHTVGESLPPAAAVVNPQRADCRYPEKGLCGTGVVFRLAELVGRRLDAPSGALDELLDLVALATVADLVPLTGENRVFVHFGLRRFADSRIPGLRALLDVSEVPLASVTAGQLGFRVAPRINAAGRIGDSADALRLLLTDDPVEAGRIAAQLDAINTQRRDEDRRTLDEALATLAEIYDPESDFGVVLAGEGWHPGVIGIVASRVVERIHRPVVLVALTDGAARGSARSIPGFHLYESLSECAEHLARFGGHKQAAGMDVHPGSLESFRLAFNAAARRRLEGQDLRPSLRPDLDLDLSAVDERFLHWLSYLGPHGMGNPGPLFRARSVALEGSRLVGTNHVKATLRSAAARVDGIGFGLADVHDVASLGQRAWDVLFRLEANEWRGRVTPQAKIIALHPAAL
jgi:single-stranded-DNA-specific exonuclease